MGDRLPIDIEKARIREKIFFEHEKYLKTRALRLTRGSHEDADDLMQDLFVRFIQSEAAVDTSNVDRVRGYLYRTLANLYSSKLLSTGSGTLTSLDAVDYDSMEFALTAIDRSQLMHVHSDLARICEYACIRRRSSRAGSVLILRFFFDYYPSEIVRILRTSSTAVNKLTETARLEAKVYLTRPGSLHFLGQSPRPAISFPRYLPNEPVALFAELRRLIFKQAEGTCPAPGELEKAYAEETKEQVTTQELAHIVTCTSCLERLNRLLHLPTLRERFSDDSYDPNGGNFPPSSTGSKGGTLRKMRKKLADTFEHRPRKLQLAVNGEIHSAHDVTSSVSRFQIKLKPFSHPEFIDIRSDQGLRLLYLDLQTDEFEQQLTTRAEAGFSEGRSLALEVSLNDGCPVVTVHYHDPMLDERSEDWAFEQELQSLAIREEEIPLSVPSWKRFGLGAGKRFLSLFPGLDRRWSLAIALTLGLLAYLFIATEVKVTHRNSAPSVTAASLLDEAKRAASLAIPPHGAVHQTFSFEVRSGKGKLLQAGRVEALRSTIPRRSAMRLTTSTGKLLAGRWSSASGNVSTYSTRQGLRRSTDPTPVPFTSENAWLHMPEASDFEALSGGADNLQVQHDRAGYDLSVAEATRISSSGLTSANLVLASDTKRPIAETFRLVDGGETRVYRFQELSFEVVPADRVLDSDFDPDPELSANVARPTGSGEFDAHYALQALQLLSNLGPDVERIVDLNRSPNGELELNGVFATTAEKEDVVRVFRPLQIQSHGLMKLALHANDEPAQAKVASAATKIEALDPIPVDTEHIPLDSKFRSALSSQGLSGEALDSRILMLASTARHRASAIHRETWTIRQIAANDFSFRELRNMPPEDKMLWLTLLDKHIRSLDGELVSLNRDLSPLFPNQETMSSQISSRTFLSDTNQLGMTADALNSDGERLDQLLATALTLSPSSLPAGLHVEDIPHLLDRLKSEERVLHRTIEQLQTFGLDARN